VLNLKKVAVTGGLASGKTSACYFFENLGAYVVSADRIVHHLLIQENSIQEKVIRLLGTDILVEGKLSKEAIANRVFEDPAMLESLERILHPAVREEIEALYDKAKEEGYLLFVAEVPLLYEANLENDFDAVVVVRSSLELCRERFKKNEFNQRMERQLPQEAKAARADFVIDNDGTLGDLESSVEAVYRTLVCK
jgi:dephospho-CoA kinase